MKNYIRLFILSAFTLVSLQGVAGDLLENATYRKQVEQDLAAKKSIFGNENFFRVFDVKLNAEERDALMFLYAYMPLSDVVDYSDAFYRMNVDYSLKAKRELKWGTAIPAMLFRHFVLPIRVNNENLDDARRVFYDELVNRVKNLSMYNAILEVNHWAHEKVVYTPSDARTSSPLASVKTAYGRCGEESTFLVAALRAVGIPARQVYTPRWAHTDDNHAWVEAWADGKWYFLGACEPEPVLNLAWFNAPASRGMLMHTKVFGNYNGVEEVMQRTKNYTEINVISNYASSASVDVLVVDKAGKAVSDAKVEFKVYNYAEFYTVAVKSSDAYGKTMLSAGKGDMLVWASKDGRYGYAKVSFGKDALATIVLNRLPGETYSELLDIVPPSEAVSLPDVTPRQAAEKVRRMAQEDSIRGAYTASFMNEKSAKDFAARHGYSNEIVPLLLASRGNHKTLTDFLAVAPADKKELAVRLLRLISAKDLRDISREVLDDSFNYPTQLPLEYRDRVLNPRVENEMLVPYKAWLAAQISPQDATKYRANPKLLVEWCAKQIRIDRLYNAQQLIMSPKGVWKARVTDSRSRDVFFVSVARSLGIPAWMDLVTGKIKYLAPATSSGKSVETEANFEAVQSAQSVSGVLKLNYTPLAWLDNPKYAYHFTLSKFEDGAFRLLNYDEEKVNWENTFKSGARVNGGYYMLVTGARLADGGVLSSVKYFTVSPNDTTQVELIMREDKNKVQVIGSFNAENRFTRMDDSETSLLNACGRGYYIVALLGVGQEPTNHALRDIAAQAKEFQKWGRKMVLLFPDEQSAKRFNASEFPGLPNTIVYGVDKNGAIQKEILENMKLPANKGLPLFIIADTFNRVMFVSQSYTIGLGEQMMKTIHGL